MSVPVLGRIWHIEDWRVTRDRARGMLGLKEVASVRVKVRKRTQMVSMLRIGSWNGRIGRDMVVQRRAD